MPDDAYHRTFRAFKPVGWTDPALPLHALAAFAGGMAGRLPYDGIAAYQIAGEKLQQIRVDWRKDQDFEKLATPWEKVHSKLANGARYGADPVVDSDLMVVGHYGRFSGPHIFVPKGRGLTLGNDVPQLRKMLDEDIAVFAGRHNPLPSRYEAFHNASDARWWLLTAIDGRVLAVDRSDDRGVEPSAFSPADLIGFGRLIGMTLVGVGGRLIRSLTVRPAAREVATRGTLRPLRVQTRKLTVTRSDMMAWEWQGGQQLGHTLERHGPHHSKASLKTRIMGGEEIPPPPMLPGVFHGKELRVWKGKDSTAASRWNSEADMHRGIGDVINRNLDDIRRMTSNGQEIALENVDVGFRTGAGWVSTFGPKGSRAAFYLEDLRGVTIVIRRRTNHVPTDKDPEGWYVHTAYPDVAR